MRQKTWKRNLKSKRPAKAAGNRRFDPLIGFAIGLLLISLFTYQGMAWINKWLELVLQSEPWEPEWAERADEADTSFPAVPLTDPIIYEPAPPVQVIKITPPKGRCNLNEQCRSSGVCLIVPGETFGYCGECYSNLSECPEGLFCSDDGRCVECIFSNSCAGNLLCREDKCVPPEPF